jgi:hypothetical protein
MRINPELLLKIARDHVTQRTRADRGILAVYLHGSLLSSQPLLGGATDIDLFFIHSEAPSERREIVRMTDDVHLDIAHHARALYRNARELRLDPWLGSTIHGARVLHDPQHFMDFTQASVRGHFEDAENIWGRVEKLARRARTIWLNFQIEPAVPGLESAQLYLEAVEQAANAIACLSGTPLAVRRLSLEFSARAEAVGRPGLYAGLLGLLGAGLVEPQQLHAWIPEWNSALKALPKARAGARLHPHRIHYFKVAVESALESDQPYACLWPLISTWTEAAALLDGDDANLAPWRHAMEQTGLVGDGFEERLEALDAYLDQIEETIEEWASAHGVTGE